MDIKIRKMIQEDLEAVIASGSQENNFSATPESDGFWTGEQLSNSITQGNDVLLVAESGNDIIGFAIAFIHKPTSKATFENLWVHPDTRKEGIGNALVKELIRQLRSKECLNICGLTKESNESMLQLFEKMGFEKGDKFYWMSKRL